MKNVDGLRFFPEEGSAYFYGNRVTLNGLGVIGYIQKNVNHILRKFGRKRIKDIWRKNTLPLAKSYFNNNGKSIESFIDFIKILGLGVFEVEKKNGGHRLTLRNNFLSDFFEEDGKWLNDLYMEGIIEACWQIIFGGRFECREEECIFRGGDKCVFSVNERGGEPERGNIEELSKSGGVSSPKALGFDYKEGKVYIGDKRVVIINSSLLPQLQMELKEYIGDAAHGIMKKGKREATVRWMDTVVKLNKKAKYMKMFTSSRLTPRFLKRKLMRGIVDKINDELTYFGFGKVKSVEFGDRIKVKVDNSFIVDEYTDSDRPVCDFLSGLFEGVADFLMANPQECSEVKCQAAGDDFCEFILEPSK